MINIPITEQDILDQLALRSDSTEEQVEYAKLALRVGLQALAAAHGELDRHRLTEIAESMLMQVDTIVSDALRNELSLDNDNSPMRRLSSEMQRNNESIIGHLSAVLQQRTDHRQPPAGGGNFEEGIGLVPGEIANGAGDQFEATGSIPGKLSMNKKGDFVITIGQNSHLANRRIVIEAKRDKSYTLKRALDECRVAAENRDADVAIFVWDREYGELRGQPPLQMHGNAVIVLWDAEDPMTNIYLRAAYWLAQNLIQPEIVVDPNVTFKKKKTAQALKNIVALIASLDEVSKSAKTIQTQNSKIINTVKDMRDVLDINIKILQDNVQTLIDSSPS